jgi:acyl-CoA reductase-like NAD-dependent aldehyde dehydrogenase
VVLNRLADLIEANAEELAQLETLCSGKSINLSRGLEIAQSVVFALLRRLGEQDHRADHDPLAAFVWW